ncbi:MAG: Hsp20/alpha crystallin family protein [Gammaproteobacteria bacterium]|nr:Hsp20/alpha crystallin family protein [Gammaproteobacteria bacterium]
MERWFDEAFGRGWLRPRRWEWPALEQAIGERAPHVDVIDRENEILVRAEMPGVKKDELDVSVNEDSVTIRGETRREDEREEDQYYQCEIARAAFLRTVSLPGPVDPEKAKAQLRDGVLELTLPKVEGSKRRKISIEE